MALHNFYEYILEQSSEPNTLIATIQLNTDHQIFKGHFPGNPVLPGACQVQIIKEIVSEFFQKKIILRRAKEIKFISILDLNKETSFTLRIDHTLEDPKQIGIKALLYKEDQKLSKIRATFEEEQHI